MLIHVKYSDNKFDYVKEIILDILIDSNKITEFKRSSGWVIIGSDPIRNTKRDQANRETTH
jgi:hypothetical protein